MPLPARFDTIPLVSWRAEYGPFATDYVAVDLESTGIDIHRDYVLQFGFCVVKNKVASLSADFIVDWTKVLTGYALNEFKLRLEQTRKKMDEKGKAYPWTLDLLNSKGKSPVEVAARMAKLLPASMAVAAHYGMLFDYPMIGRFMTTYGQSFSPDTDKMYDTGLLMKACLSSISPIMGEDPIPYYKRIMDLPHRGAKHNLESCIDIFELKNSGAAKKDSHLAAFDSWVVHMILENLRGMSSVLESKDGQIV